MRILRAIGIFILTLAMYLGVLLSGWGILKLPEFLSYTPRLMYAIIACLFALAIGIQSYHSMEGIQDSKGSKEKTVRRQTIIGTVLVGLVFVLLFLIPFLSRRNIGTYAIFVVMGWLGDGIVALGYLLIFWSGLALGKQYSGEVTIQDGHQLITSGPYRIIRHPRYMGILCVAFGVCLIFNSWLGLASMPVIIALILSRVYDEEVMLAREFGKTWQVYCKRTRRLIPFIF